jgi:sulfur-oxidizing protein SoxB
LDANKTYRVAGWAPVSEDAKNAGGEPIWDVIARHLRDVKTVKAVKLNEPIIKGAKGNPGMAAI